MFKLKVVILTKTSTTLLLTINRKRDCLPYWVWKNSPKLNKINLNFKFVKCVSESENKFTSKTFRLTLKFLNFHNSKVPKSGRNSLCKHSNLFWSKSYPHLELNITAVTDTTMIGCILHEYRKLDMQKQIYSWSDWTTSGGETLC